MINNHWFVSNLNNFKDQLALVHEDNEYKYDEILKAKTHCWFTINTL